MSKQTDFFNKYANDAINTQLKYGVPASITLAQGALESAWGQSGLTVNANNFFGIKASSDWKGEIYSANTTEWNGSIYAPQVSKFRKYKTAQDSFIDHALFLKKYQRYAFLFDLDELDYQGWANGLKTAGYATDPLYASKLISMINTYKLYEYDKQAVKKKTL